MKLCGRIDVDVPLMRYRNLLRKIEQMERVKPQPKKKTRMIVQHGAFRYWRRRLADAAR